MSLPSSSLRPSSSSSILLLLLPLLSCIIFITPSIHALNDGEWEESFDFKNSAEFNIHVTNNNGHSGGRTWVCGSIKGEVTPTQLGGANSKSTTIGDDTSKAPQLFLLAFESDGSMPEAERCFLPLQSEGERVECTDLLIEDDGDTAYVTGNFNGHFIKSPSSTVFSSGTVAGFVAKFSFKQDACKLEDVKAISCSDANGEVYPTHLAKIDGSVSVAGTWSSDTCFPTCTDTPIDVGCDDNTEDKPANPPQTFLFRDYIDSDTPECHVLETNRQDAAVVLALAEDASNANRPSLLLGCVDGDQNIDTPVVVSIRPSGEGDMVAAGYAPDNLVETHYIIAGFLLPDISSFFVFTSSSKPRGGSNFYVHAVTNVGCLEKEGYHCDTDLIKFDKILKFPIDVSGQLDSGTAAISIHPKKDLSKEVSLLVIAARSGALVSYNGVIDDCSAEEICVFPSLSDDPDPWVIELRTRTPKGDYGLSVGVDVSSRKVACLFDEDKPDRLSDPDSPDTWSTSLFAFTIPDASELEKESSDEDTGTFDDYDSATSGSQSVTSVDDSWPTDDDSASNGGDEPDSEAGGDEPDSDTDGNTDKSLPSGNDGSNSKKQPHLTDPTSLDMPDNDKTAIMILMSMVVGTLFVAIVVYYYQRWKSNRAPTDENGVDLRRFTRMESTIRSAEV
eukprot:TRINITY_DN5805_c0_g1_i1.p1 TRINITY_DN5805_c0_g1~~TRINITY_DN5805_c0_g1_i1.p1  ORF type:complete len:674 (-),score=143.08 TRINITY_DN5805_c0_g1_i1:47-2068(-)